jgi:hypothetical protein
LGHLTCTEKRKERSNHAIRHMSSEIQTAYLTHVEKGRRDRIRKEEPYLGHPTYTPYAKGRKCCQGSTHEYTDYGCVQTVHEYTDYGCVQTVHEYTDYGCVQTVHEYTDYGCM